MLTVPHPIRTACWLNAWLAGAASADDTIQGLVGTEQAVHFRRPGEGSVLTPALWLGELRRLGVSSVSAALPVPGDLAGLGGPSAFNEAALDAGGAVLLYDVGLGLLPQCCDDCTAWVPEEAHPPTYRPHLPEAAQQLREELRHAADALARLDVAAWSPDAADVLLNLRRPGDFDAAMTFAHPDAAPVAVTALRCLQIVTEALRDDGGALSASAAAERRAVLDPLGRAARTALVAAASEPGR